jgi:cytochrome P450
VTTPPGVHFDPYDPEIFADPYPAYRRLRADAPLYYNEPYDFYAVSRFPDVERGMTDRETYVSCHGDLLDMIRSDMPVPSGILQLEEEPVHSIHRNLLSRVFTPKSMNALEPDVRAYCRRILEPLRERDEFDFVHDFAEKLPMRVIGMLLGVPEADQDELRDHLDRVSATETGSPKDFGDDWLTGEVFGDYVDWRVDHPSDDLMTRLLTSEFVDEHGETRRLAREEVLVYVNVLAGAGNETTKMMLGWMGSLLAAHPDARRDVAADRSLIPNAVEEILRYEPPNYGFARYVARDTEIQGSPVPAGSAILLLVPSANRDEEFFPDGDVFDVHRDIRRHFSFGYGAHFCLGAALARVEGRVALDELLTVLPEWDVDWGRAHLDNPVGHRGYGTLPVSTG